MLQSRLSVFSMNFPVNSLLMIPYITGQALLYYCIGLAAYGAILIALRELRDSEYLDPIAD